MNSHHNNPMNLSPMKYIAVALLFFAVNCGSGSGGTTSSSNFTGGLDDTPNDKFEDKAETSFSYGEITDSKCGVTEDCPDGQWCCTGDDKDDKSFGKNVCVACDDDGGLCGINEVLYPSRKCDNTCPAAGHYTCWERPENCTTLIESVLGAGLCSNVLSVFLDIGDCLEIIGETAFGFYACVIMVPLIAVECSEVSKGKSVDVNKIVDAVCE